MTGSIAAATLTSISGDVLSDRFTVITAHGFKIQPTYKDKEQLLRIDA